MKPLVLAATLGFFAVLTLNVLPLRASAIEAPKIKEASLELRNIKPSVMAYWLDPQHSQIAMSERIPLQNDFAFVTMPSRPKQGEVPPPIDPSLVVLPTGVEKLTADDSQNVLVVRGSQEGIERVSELVLLLDKPIPQFKIESQWLRIPKSVVLVGKLTNRSSSAEVEAFDGQAVLDLVATKKATIVNAPTITTFNKMLAQTVSIMTMSVAVPAPNGDKTRALTLYVGQGIFSSMTPTFTRAGDIELKIDFLDGFILDDKDHALRYAKRVDYRPIPSEQNRTIQTTITFSRDGKKFVALRNVKQNDAQDQYVLLVRATPFQLN